MFNAIAGLLKSFFNGVGALFTWLSQRTLIEAGRNEVELRNKAQALKDLEIAREIDSRPIPPDVLDQLLPPKD